MPFQSGVNCVQLDGSMSIDARDAAVKRFAEDPDCRIFLMSLKAGGTALNLTAASHVSFAESLKCVRLFLSTCVPINMFTSS